MERRMKKSFEEFVAYDATKNFVDNLEYLIDAAEDCELQDSFMVQYREYIDRVCDLLKLTEQEVLMLCPFLKNSDKSFDVSDIARFYDCSSMRAMRYVSALKTLLKKGYIEKSIRHGKGEFKLAYKALEAISEGKCLEDVEPEKLTPMTFMKTLDGLFEAKRRDNIDEEMLTDELLALLRENSDFNISQRVLGMSLSNDSKVILMYFCKEAVWENNMEIDDDDLKNLLDSHGIFIYREIVAGSHELVEKGLIEVKTNEGMFGPSDNLILTETAQADLLKVDFNFVQKQNNKTFHNVVKGDSIKKKELFFGEKNRASLDTLKELLDEKKLMDIRNQLKNKGWGLGFTCLFYGAPGTGKTESVLQIARESGRDIMQVDISSTRNKWYGETEKQIKKIFTDYKDLVKQSKKTPILLFNEADAILSVRSELGADSSSISKTENAIQNILLQEMEIFDGILIATTNLTNNLDAAFERRFLYKIKFEKPDIEVKGEIWRSLMPALTKDEAKMLASEFDFSGGEISNIARKCFINELLFNDATTLEQIKEVCGQEKLTKRVRIGF